MTKTSNFSGITTSPTFALYFLYAAWIWLCDVVDLFCYLTGLAQCTLLSRILVTVLVAGAVLLARGHVQLRRVKKDPLFYVGCLLILAFTFLKAIIADYSYDANNYHVLVQEPGYVNALRESFMLGGFQMFGFRWADRMVYLFRALLGYRMGTIFTGVTAVLVYLQIWELMRELWGERLQRIRKKMPCFMTLFLLESTLSFCVVMTGEVIVQLGSYMVDIIAVPFIMEAFCLLLTTRGRSQSAVQMTWFALLNGCFFACKMTHVVYAAPLILIYLAVHNKEVTVKRFITAFVVAFTPVCVYLVYNFAETGNPVFPYFNAIFKSPFFNDVSFKDTRWGPSNWKELLAWPFISSFDPYYNLSEVPNQFPTGTIMMLFVVIMTVLKVLCRPWKGNETSGLLVLLIISSCYFWAASTGHSRYFLFGYILSALLVMDFITDILDTERLAFRLATLIPLALLFLQPVWIMGTAAMGYEYGWRYSVHVPSVQRSLPYIFRDQNPEIDGEVQGIPEPDMLLCTWMNNGSLTHSLYPDTPVVLMNFLYSLESEHTLEVRDYWVEHVRDTVARGTVYEAQFNGIQLGDYKLYNENLKNYGYAVGTVYWPDTIYNADEVLSLSQIIPAEESTGVYHADTEGDALAVANSRIRFSAKTFLNRSHYNYIDDNPVYVSVIASDGVKTETVYTLPLREAETLQMDTELDLRSFGEAVTLSFHCEDKDGQPLREYYTCVILNPVIQ